MKINNLFSTIYNKNNGFKKINENHPVDLFLGIENKKYTILLICESCPIILPTMEFIQIEIRPRKRGTWAFIIQLKNNDMFDIFCKLAEDLISVTQKNPTKPENLVIKRLLQWKKLLAPKKNATLSNIKGFIGELGFLFQEALPVLGEEISLRSWVGPYNFPKDFIFNETEIEVKSTSLSSKYIQINSLEQLTDTGKNLFIWHQPLEVTYKKNKSYKNLLDWFNEIRSCFLSNKELAEDFDETINRNILIDKEIFKSIYFKFYSPTCYKVDQNFPRIQYLNIFNGIIECKYKINLYSIQPYRVPTWRPL
jgi:hypothetical protein